ncbi:MAG: diguanylate cyclase [Chitinivibrionales bacterium]|nr:diguanylate cyclase [Chitinivibrionales bacterium]
MFLSLEKKNWLIAGALILCAGIILHLAALYVQALCLPLAIFLCALCLFIGFRRPTVSRKRAMTPARPSSSGMLSLPSQIEKEVNAADNTIKLSVLGSLYSKEQWKEIEDVVDIILDKFIALVRARVDAHTVAFFFPSDDGGYKIRRFDSCSENINKEAVIYPGVGVIGSFLKDGLKQLNLQDIVTDSMTLYYYTKDAGIRSLMASPIIAAGIERGTIIVDSTEQKHFTDEDHTFLSTIGHLCGQAAYYAYVHTEHKLKYVRFAAMSNTEKYFFQKHEIEAVLDKMAEIIPFAIQCDRLTISLKSESGDSATIKRAWGPNGEQFLDQSFSLNEKSLISLLYSKNMCFFRNFSNHYETRYFDGEPKSKEMRSFLAYPVGVDECKGGILLESTQKDAFTGFNRALLSRLATSAGLAIEKIQILEQARNLATHDGLTGLNNHRQFQKLLRDEIIRSTRYNDPLALVIGDIDFFKKINDTHGHPFGDTVLRGIAKKLQESIRDSIDISARYGGEEFALILVKTVEQRAIETVDRIRQEINKQVFRTPSGEDMSASMSFGIAIYGKHSNKSDGLIQKADKALYRAKQNGRNRVEVF